MAILWNPAQAAVLHTGDMSGQPQTLSSNEARDQRQPREFSDFGIMPHPPLASFDISDPSEYSLEDTPLEDRQDVLNLFSQSSGF